MADEFYSLEMLVGAHGIFVRTLIETPSELDKLVRTLILLSIEENQ